MKKQCDEIRVHGIAYRVPSTCVNERTVVAIGKWVKIAAVKDEDVYEGEVVGDPESFIRELKQQQFKADLFSFAQRLSEPMPKHRYHMEWDNAAVIPITSYADWEKRLSQETRRNIRRAAKAGVITQTARFDDEFVKGIVEIYNEIPVRQGRPFWHYGKSFETVKQETESYLDRSEFIGAYHDNRLIGFCKMIYADNCAKLVLILSRNDQADKRPTNALIAKAVQISAEKRLAYVTYCKYVYGKNDESALTEFKRRNGFEQLLYPRYFVPLSTKGRIILSLKLHHGLKNLLPKRLVIFLLDLRARLFRMTARKTPLAVEAS